MKKLLIALTSCLVMSYSAIAQNVEFKSSNFPGDKAGFKEAMTNYRKGMKYFEMGPNHFDEALDYCLKAETFNPNEANLNYHIGVIYSFRRNEKAIGYFEKAMQLDAYYKVHGYYSLAEKLHHEKKWDEAISEYREYIRLLQETRKKTRKGERFLVDEDIRNTEMRIKQCENGKNYSEVVSPVLITNIGSNVNSPYPDYAPVVDKEQKLLIFTSRREGNLGKKYAPYDIYPYEDIYFSRRNDNGTWSEAKLLEGKVNSKKHDASVWLSEDGKRLIIYRYKQDGNLYESKNEDGKWSKPKKVAHVNSGYRETHASVTADGKTIYFTSDNPKLTKGDMLDIYKITYNEEKKKWSKPENLGDVINTEYDEACVFISPDGNTMYFSSEGHTSIGGLDIFKTELKDGKWTEPENIGYPVSSTYDDVFISVTADGTGYYMDSDRRSGEGDKDIYVVTDLKAVKVPLVVKVYNNVTKEMIDAEVTVTEKSGNQVFDVEKTGTGEYHSTLKSFKKYNVSVKSDGFNDYTAEVNSMIKDPENLTVNQDVYMEPVGFLVLNGHVKDKSTGAPVPATIELVQVDNGEKPDVKNNDGNFESSLANGKKYKLTISAEGYTPHVEDITLTDALDKDFLISRVGESVVLQNIYFDFDKSTLRSESVDELKNLKSILDKSPGMRVEISGHTDNIGSRTYNYSLSNRRAKAVVNWLIKEGVAGKQLESKGYGFDKPAATNDTDEGRQLNRRVEFKLIPLK